MNLWLYVAGAGAAFAVVATVWIRTIFFESATESVGNDSPLIGSPHTEMKVFQSKMVGSGALAQGIIATFAMTSKKPLANYEFSQSRKGFSIVSELLATDTNAAASMDLGKEWIKISNRPRDHIGEGDSQAKPANEPTLT